jgi:hypothetical protein
MREKTFSCMMKGVALMLTLRTTPAEEIAPGASKIIVVQEDIEHARPCLIIWIRSFFHTFYLFSSLSLHREKLQPSCPGPKYAEDFHRTGGAFLDYLRLHHTDGSHGTHAIPRHGKKLCANLYLPRDSGYRNNGTSLLQQIHQVLEQERTIRPRSVRYIRCSKDCFSKC